MNFSRSLEFKDDAEFKSQIIEQLQQLTLEQLPLQQSLQLGNQALNDDTQFMIINIHRSPTHIDIDLGIFFTSVISGCNCADDPSPIDKLNEYTEWTLAIDLNTGAAGFYTK